MSRRSAQTKAEQQPEVPAQRRAGAVIGPLLLTVEEAGAAIGVGRSLMYELISRGDISTVRIGRLRRVRPEDLENYVAALRA